METLSSDGPLSGLRVFVGGPIQHALLPPGFDAEPRELISSVIETVEASGATVLSAHRLEGFGKYTDRFTPEMVSVRDYGWMRECDVFVPVFPVLADGVLLRTDGTHVEVGWASALGRPIVLITRLPFVASASHLLKGISSVGNVRAVDVEDFRRDPSHLVGEVLVAVGRQRPSVPVGTEG
ncbi:hypothetical protein [Nonomuraea sp. JJY05]|jgi:nucleoside 2-deoxyribosyltransferase|uniref:hypothetical protein n=1 Tax=Nonomuraea sp. JJY05 TaxID=3350255 RepID=UPI00373FAEC2